MFWLFRYFIPEDGDVEIQPNVFLAPKPRQPGYPPTLGEIKQAFPLPGRYHFRFKAPLMAGSDRDKGSMAVWMDCTNDRQPVPVWQSQIIAKLTRIGVEEDDDDDDDDDDFRRSTPTATSAPQQQHQAPPPPQQQQPPPQMQHTPVTAAAPAAASFDLFDGPTHAPAPASHGYSMEGSGSMGGLFDSHVSAAPVSSGGSASLFDLNYQQPAVSSSAVHSDFLGMTSAPSPPVSGNYGGYGMQQPPQPPQQQRPPQQQQQLRSNGSFDSFGKSGGGAFGDLGTPWK
jgi:DIX domain